MLTIRRPQLLALRAVRRKAFITEMIRYLRTHFPEELANVKDHQLRGHVTRTLTRARSYGLTSRQDCARFLNLAVLFGWDFDEDPKNAAWVKETLADNEVHSPGARLDRLVKRFLRRMELEANRGRMAGKFMEI